MSGTQNTLAQAKVFCPECGAKWPDYPREGRMVASQPNMEPIAHEVTPVIEPAVRMLCQKPYPGHPRGCPNFGKKRGCPPETPMFDQVYDLGLPIYAIVTTFDLGAHAEKMRERHPDWSWARLSCCLYWQQGARKKLQFEIAKFLRSHPGYRAEATPEALGINVTATLQRAGFPVLEWPPVHLARQVAVAAVPKECPEGCVVARWRKPSGLAGTAQVS